VLAVVCQPAGSKGSPAGPITLAAVAGGHIAGHQPCIVLQQSRLQALPRAALAVRALARNGTGDWPLAPGDGWEATDPVGPVWLAALHGPRWRQFGGGLAGPLLAAERRARALMALRPWSDVPTYSSSIPTSHVRGRKQIH